MTGLRHALSLSSSTYKNHVLQGFARLQQNDEFVDMTLAADGHWVKVHRTLVALLSPFFKDLLRSLPSQHPVIYLNGVSNEALGYILEYIYTGETQIPAGEVKSFLKTAQELQIAGLKNITLPEDNDISSQYKDTEHIQSTAEQIVCSEDQVSLQLPVPHSSRVDNEDRVVNVDLHPQEPAIDPKQSNIENENNEYNDPSTLNEPVSPEETSGFQNLGYINTPSKSINITLNENSSNNSIGQNPVAKIEIHRNILINGDSYMTMSGQDQLPQSYTEPLGNVNNEDISINQTSNISIDGPATTQMNTNPISNNGDNIPMSEDEDISESALQDCNNSATRNTLIQIINLDNGEQLRQQQDSLLYTSSNRGALQLILNRFMYYCHYERDNGRKKRWRCIDYRDAHCPAAIDTNGEEIVDRKYKHCHPNHDEKIRKKLSKSNVKCFPTIQLAEALTKQASAP